MYYRGVLVGQRNVDRPYVTGLIFEEKKTKINKYYSSFSTYRPFDMLGWTSDVTLAQFLSGRFSESEIPNKF